MKMQLGELGLIKRRTAAEARVAAAAVTASRQNYMATIAQENTPANKAALLPAGGAYLIGGTPFTPGVNATFGLGISQTDLDNIRAGKVLYTFYPAHMYTPPRPPHVRTNMKAQLVHAKTVPSYLMNDLLNYLSGNRSATLAQVNQYLSIKQQKAEQDANSSFNKDALMAIAAFATIGYAAAALAPTAEAGAGAGAGAGGAGATLTTATPYAEVGYTGTAAVAPASYGAVGTAAQEAAAAAESAGYATATGSVASTASTSLLSQAGSWLSSQIPTTDSLIASGESAAGTQATKLITGMLSPPAPAKSLSTVPSLSTTPVPATASIAGIMPLILGGLSLLAFFTK